MKLDGVRGGGGGLQTMDIGSQHSTGPSLYITVTVKQIMTIQTTLEFRRSLKLMTLASVSISTYTKRTTLQRFKYF